MRITIILAAILIAILTYMSFNGGEMSYNTPLIPRETLFGNPDRMSVTLSDDGKYLAYVAPLNGVLNIYVASIDNIKEAKPITADTGRGIRSYSWTRDGSKIIYMQDKDGDENFALYLTDVASPSEPIRISPENARSGIVAASKNKPDEIIFSANDRNPSYFDLYKYTISTGETKRILENDKYSGMTVDSDHNIRFLSENLADGSVAISKYDNGTISPFKTIAFEDITYSGIVGINRAGDKLYMLDSSERDTAGLFEIDLLNDVRTLIAEPKEGEITDIIFDNKTKTPQGYSYDYTIEETVFFDKRMEAAYKALKTPSEKVVIVSRTFEDDKWIVALYKSDAPVSYYLFNPETHKKEFLFVNSEKLKGLDLAEMKPVIIKARDGLEMVSYLTMPKGASSPVPMVLLVHGGPQARDDWGYNPQHQFLANRGYAVLSVNYRGSLGFGKSFVRKGYGEWSAKMHDDLIDAVRWAVDQGIAQEDKIAIFGGSYGGYAALVGVTYTPDTFACAVDIVGPSNLETLYNSIPPYWEPFKVSLTNMLGGNTDTPAGVDVLKSKSPLYLADKITKPLLIGQGANDPRVKQAESDQIVKAMNDNNIPVTYLLYPDEGHGFVRPENRLSFYAYAENFLSKCIGGRAEAVSTANSSVQIKSLDDSSL